MSRKAIRNHCQSGQHQRALIARRDRLQHQSALREQEAQISVLLAATSSSHHHIQQPVLSGVSQDGVGMSTLEEAMWEDFQLDSAEFHLGDLSENCTGLQYLNAQLKLFDCLDNEVALANRLGLNSDDDIFQEDILDDEEFLRLQGIEETLGQFRAFIFYILNLTTLSDEDMLVAQELGGRSLPKDDTWEDYGFKMVG
jgi:hypothetical protein